MIAILDADKEGFLRSETSMIQTIGRAARNAEGKVIMYADAMTSSMKSAICETERRRKIQSEYNEKHGIVPKTIQKAVYDVIEATVGDAELDAKEMLNQNKENIIEELTEKMQEAARMLQFELAAQLRDEIKRLRE